MTTRNALSQDRDLDDRVYSALVAASLQDNGYAYVPHLDRIRSGA